MPRTIWTKVQSDPNGTWSRHEGEPPFSIPATAGMAYDVYADTGESFVITPLATTAPPLISGAPAVTGLYEVGQTLTAIAAPSTGTAPIGVSWQWLRDGADIPGATGASYLLVAADESAQLSVRQTDTNAYGSDSAFSAAQTVLPSSAGAAVISGLSVSDQNASGDLSLTYSISADSAVTGVITDTSQAPGAAQILAGQDYTGSVAADQFTDTWTTAGSDTLPDIADGIAQGIYYLHVLPAGGSDGDVVTSNSFTLETILPSVTSAATSTDGAAITLSLSEAVSGTANAADWTVNGSSGSTVSGVSIGATTITLTLGGSPIASGDTVTLDYAPGDIRDLVANPLAAFSGLAVTNTVASYTDTLVTVNGAEAWLEAPAGGHAPAGTDSLMFFFSGTPDVTSRKMLVSVRGATEGIWSSFTGGTDNGLRWRPYSETDNLTDEVSAVPAGERYAVIGTYHLQNGRSYSKIRIWRASTGWQPVVTKDEADAGSTLQNFISDAPFLFRRSDSTGNEYTGTVARMALFAATDGDSSNAPIADINDTAVLDEFIDAATGITEDPALSAATHGTPLWDFHGPASRYNLGVHGGSLGTFTRNGAGAFS